MMKKSYRYLIVTIGTIIFFALAPFVVFYTQGYTFDKKSGEVKETGILVVVSEPQNVEIWLNGKLTETTNKTSVQYLEPGTYDLEVKEQGYLSWKKQLPIFAGKVTKIPDTETSVHLLATPQKFSLSKNTRDFVLTENQLVYISGKSLNIANTDKPQDTRSYSLGYDYVNIAKLGDSKLLWLNGEKQNAVFDLSSNTILTTPNLLTGDTLLASGNNKLYLLSKESLYLLESKTSKKTLIASKVSSCYTGNGLFYCLQKNTDNWQIYNVTDQASLPINFTLPKSIAESPVTLLISPQKEIFLLSNNTLFQLKSELENLASGVYTYTSSSGSYAFSYTTPYEMQILNLGSKSSTQITRGNEKIQAFSYAEQLGYAFIAVPGHLTATELDKKFGTNTYEIDTPQVTKKMVFDGKSSSVFYIDGTELKQVQFKN